MIPPAYVRSHGTARLAVERGRLLLLVLEGGQAFLLRARTALEHGDFVAYVTDVRRTQDVLREVSQAPEHEADGPLATRLAHLQELLVGRLALARADGSRERIDEVLGAYAALVEAYRDAVRPPDATT
jgi:flagellin-specific chaperone FliS